MEEGRGRQGPGLRFLGQQQEALLPGPLVRKGHRGGAHPPDRETQTDVMGSHEQPLPKLGEGVRSSTSSHLQPGDRTPPTHRVLSQTTVQLG